VNSEETIVALRDKAAKAGLALLLVGGHAVISHGVSRNTFDLDLVVARERRGDWVKLLGELGYTIYIENPNFTQLSAPNSERLPVDLMLVNAETFEKLLEEAIQLPAHPAGVKVVCLRHLLSLKCHAIKFGHPGRIVKDVDDVINLINNNDLDLRESDLRALILKHGTEELYEKLVRATQS
jgi:hypothetical protein